MSSHYVSDESIAEESDDLEIKGMSLEPFGAALLRDYHGNTAPTTMAEGATTTKVPATDESDQMQIYFAKAMEKFLHDCPVRRKLFIPPPPTTRCSGRVCRTLR